MDFASQLRHARCVSPQLAAEEFIRCLPQRALTHEEACDLTHTVVRLGERTLDVGLLNRLKTALDAAGSFGSPGFAAAAALREAISRAVAHIGAQTPASDREYTSSEERSKLRTLTSLLVEADVRASSPTARAIAIRQVMFHHRFRDNSISDALPEDDAFRQLLDLVVRFQSARCPADLPALRSLARQFCATRVPGFDINKNGQFRVAPESLSGDFTQDLLREGIEDVPQTVRHAPCRRGYVAFLTNQRVVSALDVLELALGPTDADLAAATGDPREDYPRPPADFTSAGVRLAEECLDIFNVLGAGKAFRAHVVPAMRGCALMLGPVAEHIARAFERRCCGVLSTVREAGVADIADMGVTSAKELRAAGWRRCEEAPGAAPRLRLVRGPGADSRCALWEAQASASRSAWASLSRASRGALPRARTVNGSGGSSVPGGSDWRWDETALESR